MSTLLKDYNNRIVQLMQPAAAHQTVSVGVASAQSSAVGASTTIVELYCDTLCFVAIGVNPTALVSGIPVYAGSPRTLQVSPGDKIAVIGTTDTLRIVEML